MANEPASIGNVKHLTKALKAVAGGAESEFWAVKGTKKPDEKNGKKDEPAVAFYVGEEGKAKHAAETKLFTNMQTVRGTIKRSLKKANRQVLECLGTPSLAKEAAKMVLKAAKLTTYAVVAMKMGEAEPVHDEDSVEPVPEAASAVEPSKAEPQTWVKAEPRAWDPAKAELNVAIKDKLSGLLPDMILLSKHDAVVGPKIKAMEEQLHRQLASNDYRAADKTVHAIEELVAVSRGTDKQLRERPTQVEETTVHWKERIDMPNYATGKLLGSGNFGNTFLLESSTQDAPRLIFKEPKTQKALKDMEDEVKFYEKIGDHPNFAKCMGMEKVNGKDGLVLELVDGKNSQKTFDELRDKYGRGEVSHEDYWGAIQFTLMRTLEAVDFMASKGVAHNDIKPDNIMIDAATGEIKLIDFGASETLGEHVGKDVPVGAGVVAPEVIRSTTTKTSDVFGVGGTAYRVGEGEYFGYADPTDKLRRRRDERFNEFAESAETGSPQEALHVQKPGGPQKEVSEIGNDGSTHVRNPGRYAAESAYTDFINKLMHPDPTKRLSAKEALEHPFMKQRILPEEDARRVLQKTLQPKDEMVPLFAKLDEVLRLGEQLSSYTMPDGQPLTGKLAELVQAGLKLFQPFTGKQEELQNLHDARQQEMDKPAAQRDANKLSHIADQVAALSAEMKSVQAQLIKVQQTLVKFGASAGEQKQGLPDRSGQQEKAVLSELTEKQKETKKRLDEEAEQRAKHLEDEKVKARMKQVRERLEKDLPLDAPARERTILNVLSGAEKYVRQLIAEGRDVDEAPLDQLLARLRQGLNPPQAPARGTGNARPGSGESEENYQTANGPEGSQPRDIDREEPSYSSGGANSAPPGRPSEETDPEEPSYSSEERNPESPGYQ